jgi:hypothetical protein
MQTYDPRDVILNVNGTIITGFAENSFISAEKNEDSFTPYVGAQGDVAVAEKADPTGKITLKVQLTSPSFLYLDNLALTKDFYPVTLIDRNTAKIYGGKECRIMKPAKADFSNEITERQFEVFVTDFKFE